MKQEDYEKKMGKVIAKAWRDPAFKQELLADTVAVLKKEGIDVPDGVEVRAVENTDKLYHIVIPPTPSKGVLSKEQLSKMSESVAKGHYCYMAQDEPV